MKSPALLWTCAIICHLKTALSDPDATNLNNIRLKKVNFSFEFDNDVEEPRSNEGTKQEKNPLLRDSVPDYPLERIEKILSESPQLQRFFKRTMVPYLGPRRRPVDPSGDISMCETSPDISYPQKLNDTNGHEWFIVNQEKYYQPVHTEVCKENGTCRFYKFFPSDHQSECKQKYSIKYLKALRSKNDEKLVEAEFNLPCGCVCTIKRIT